MLFNSYQFLLIFLPLALIGYFTLGRRGQYIRATQFLFLCSLIFYSYWNVVYLPLLLTSVTINFLLGNIIYKSDLLSPKRRLYLGFALLFNLSILAYYKYGIFIAGFFNAGDRFTDIFLSRVLPLGISFYTFQQIAYVVDIYRGQSPEPKFLNYATFITFFEHLVSGPLVLYDQLIPQIKDVTKKRVVASNIALGLFTFALGLGKKVFIADSLGPTINGFFDDRIASNFTESWLIMIAYAMQLYFDFSGYSDMAIGLSRLFNIKLPENFNSPYQARSVVDFWRRWHMTLSEFLRVYVYIPLGGNRHGLIRRYFNLAVTMMLGGIWHGAGWQFIVWGTLHGFYLIINHVWNCFEIRLPSFISRLLTFGAVVVAWTFFRAKDMTIALDVVSSMFDVSTFRTSNFAYMKLDVLLKLAIFTVIANFMPNTKKIIDLVESRPGKVFPALALGFFGYLLMLSLNEATEFLYFEF